MWIYRKYQKELLDMETVIVHVNNKTYKCKVARTDEEQKKGLMGVKSLPEDEGMLFVWENEGTRNMWMKNCPMPIEQIGINEDEEVTVVYQAEPNNETLIPFTNVKYILEVNIGSGIKEGDEVEIEDEKDSEYVMKVLAPDGSVQMELKGGERIFSRKSTKQLIKWAKKAESVKSDEQLFTKYCKRLGKIMFKELEAQDTRDPEYVQVPD